VATSLPVVETRIKCHYFPDASCIIRLYTVECMLVDTES